VQKKKFNKHLDVHKLLVNDLELHKVQFTFVK